MTHDESWKIYRLKIRSVTDPAQLGELLDGQIPCLHPRRLSIYLLQNDGDLHATRSDWPQLERVPADVAGASA